MKIIAYTLLAYLACTIPVAGQKIKLDTRPLAKMTPSPQATPVGPQAASLPVPTQPLLTPAPTPAPTPEPTAFSENDQTPAVPIAHFRPRTSDEMLAMAKAAKAKDDILIAYDRFKDETTISSRPENLVGTWESVGAIMSSAPRYGGGAGQAKLLFTRIESIFGGQTMKDTPDKFALVFYGSSPDWQFLKTGSKLYVIYDDKRMTLDAVARDHSVVKWNRVDEAVAYVITRDQLETLTRAGKVEIRIGDAKPRELKSKILSRWSTLLNVTALEREK